MTDLDRQIAEIKGWAGFEIREGIFCYVHPKIDVLKHGDRCLVLKTGRYGHVDLKPGDEFTAYAAPGSVMRVDDPLSIKVYIGLRWSTSDSKALELVDEPEVAKLDFVLKKYGTGWFAYFLHLPSCQTMDGEAPTRPEAICRAYIAAVTWMRGRKS